MNFLFKFYSILKKKTPAKMKGRHFVEKGLAIHMNSQSLKRHIAEVLKILKDFGGRLELGESYLKVLYYKQEGRYYLFNQRTVKAISEKDPLEMADHIAYFLLKEKEKGRV